MACRAGSSVAQGRDHRAVSGVASQVVSAKPFHRQYRTPAQVSLRRQHGLVSAADALVTTLIPDLWSALRTGDGLGMVATIGRVVVLGSAPAHMVKARMVVVGRSYGSLRVMVKRGPQLVQLMKG